MRILYLADIRFPLERANGIQSMETCHALARRGHRVRMAVRPDTAAPARNPFEFYDLPPHAGLEFVTVRSGRHVPVGSPLRRIRYMMFALHSSLDSWPDAIVTRDLGVAAALLRLPRAARPPVIYESHGVAPVVAASLPALVSTAGAPPAGKVARLLRREARVWRTADGYATITAGLQQDLRDRFGDRANVATVADGARLPGARGFVPRTPRDRPRVVYGGHLYPWKGVDVLVRALALLPGVEGVIAGGLEGEPDLARVRALAASLELTSRVRVTGFLHRREMGETLAAADVLVLPNTETTISATYTSPLKLFEYLAAGRPIVASDLPSLREVLRPDENAVLVAPSDPPALAAGIRRVLDDDALARRLERRAFEDALDFSWDHRAERLERVLERARGF